MKFTKRILAVVMLFCVLFLSTGVQTVSASYKVSFQVYSDTVFLINTDTGTVLYEKNPDKKIYPASLTKIMTAIIAIEAVKDLENTIVTAPPYIFDELVGANASHADIRQNEEVRMIDLLYALILPSACEAGSIIADYVGGGSIPAFIQMMNDKAKALGAVNTNFTNAHGLHDPEQLTTARDMAIISQYAMSLPIFEKICTTVNYELPATNKHDKPRTYPHSNYMINKIYKEGRYYYAPIRGIKTGSIPEVGKNLASTATNNGYNYLLITMGAPDYDSDGNRWPTGTNKAFEDAKALYEWAFANFTQKKILKEKDIIDEIPVAMGSGQDYVTLVASKDINALLPNDVQSTAIQKNRTLAKDVTAPVAQGTVLGQLELKLSGETIAIVPLIASEDVKRNEMVFLLNTFKDFFFQPIVIVLVLTLLLLILLYMAFMLRYKQLKRRRAARTRRAITGNQR